jgi:hypothetical protein
MSWAHPSDAELARWAKDGTGQRAANHIEHCLWCERRLEAITELGPQLREQLDAALEPAESFEQRLHERLNQWLLNQETFAVLSDLVDVGPETARLLIAAEERDRDDE